MDREKHCMVGPYYQVEIPQQIDLNEGDTFIGVSLWDPSRVDEAERMF